MRRRSLLAGSAGLLSGCGFHPLYAPADSGAPGPAETELAAIFVPVIPDRSGQLLRQALQQRLEGSGLGEAKRYELAVSFVLVADSIGIRPDSTASRVRIIGNAPWRLTTVGLAPQPLASGAARALDGYNILDQEYFAAELENETITRRVAETIADQIVTRLAIFFRQRASAKT
jgi:LPS-assembly lipoprotein